MFHLPLLKPRSHGAGGASYSLAAGAAAGMVATRGWGSVHQKTPSRHRLQLCGHSLWPGATGGRGRRRRKRRRAGTSD